MKQLTLFPELDLDSKEPIQIDHSTNKFFNKMVERPVRKPNAVPPKTKTIKKPMSKGGSATPFQDALTNIQKPRKENMTERIERMVYQYDGNKNDKPPKHYNNPNIIDDENWGKRPRKFDNNDPSTYPSDRDQRQRLSTWDLILETSRGDKEQMKQVRETLNTEFKRNGKKYLSDKELKIIGRHSSQQPKLPEYKPSVLPTFTPPPPKEISPEERRFNQIMEEANREKIKNATSGLAGLLGRVDFEQ